jgi:hypothetical protein
MGEAEPRWAELRVAVLERCVGAERLALDVLAIDGAGRELLGAAGGLLVAVGALREWAAAR